MCELSELPSADNPGIPEDCPHRLIAGLLAAATSAKAGAAGATITAPLAAALLGAALLAGAAGAFAALRHRALQRVELTPSASSEAACGAKPTTPALTGRRSLAAALGLAAGPPSGGGARRVPARDTTSVASSVDSSER
ncbi:hypothetical protein WJX81_001609 [Elliptochloris bilobata]|uniref:Uncharacterized protein n=1 Tax=Elliptochloris bilobata TaxID=381761 RepID=A0AAW1RN84_9CHLO